MSQSQLNELHPVFAMPFGTRIMPEGGVLFRLWAPAAGEVDLCLTTGPESLQVEPMASQGDGWFVRHHPQAKIGQLYQFRIDRDLMVPDPASRCQVRDIHGPSVICDPEAFRWQDEEWQGRPWEESVIYEIHVGTFSEAGTFAGVRERLDYLADLGITAIELMPLAQFPGKYNWGYDGALLFAPCNRYGSPEDLKELVQAAHRKNIMVFLDVVYNHFGPEGNYLHVYAKEAFFTERYHTPWGAAINFSGPQSRGVRDFYIANALYWLKEFHFDGLRFDAVHAIFDESRPDILEEIALEVHKGPAGKRHVHLVLENDRNCARYLDRTPDGRPLFYTAQWNDDIHHACHILLTGESGGYYQDYTDGPLHHLGRCLTEGFAYQGEVSSYRGGRIRGEPSRHLTPLAFVSFLQNHDQIGNRAFGERLITLCEPEDLLLISALLLLAPSPPLLFMGEEFGAENPFYFFSDFGPELAESVTRGRRREFACFPEFSTEESQRRIPDPNAPETFLASRLDWRPVDAGEAGAFADHYRKLIAIRRREIIPRLKEVLPGKAGCRTMGEKALTAWWPMVDGSKLSVICNLQDTQVEAPPGGSVNLIFQLTAGDVPFPAGGICPAKSIAWFLCSG